MPTFNDEHANFHLHFGSMPLLCDFIYKSKKKKLPEIWFISALGIAFTLVFKRNATSQNVFFSKKKDCIPDELNHELSSTISH